MPSGLIDLAAIPIIAAAVRASGVLCGVGDRHELLLLLMALPTVTPRLLTADPSLGMLGSVLQKLSAGERRSRMCSTGWLLVVVLLLRLVERLRDATVGLFRLEGRRIGPEGFIFNTCGTFSRGVLGEPVAGRMGEWPRALFLACIDAFSADDPTTSNYMYDPF